MMISTRKRPLILGGMLLSAVAGSSRPSRAQEATPATPITPTPPTQPTTGPGGADYAYDQVIVHDYNQGPPPGVSRSDYWLFEPADAPADVPLPLVVFLVGGMEGASPDSTRAWIDHLVRRGAVAIFPAGWSMSEIDETSFQVSAALAEIERGGHPPVDLSRVAVVGQGFGGAMAARMAAAPPGGLPAPTALMVMMPTHLTEMLPEDLAALPSETHVVLVGVGDAPAQSNVASANAALNAGWEALAKAGRVPAEQRSYVVIRSDDHGTPPLVATEHVALAMAGDSFFGPNALNWYGSWKLLDGLMACSFDDEWCEYAFGDTPEQRFMGTWSDGVPVTEALVIGDPATPVP